jgi:hypothetical protein
MKISMKINRLKMQFDERKRKLIVSGAICSAKKTGFNTGRGRREYKCGCTRNTFKN